MRNSIKNKLVACFGSCILLMIALAGLDFLGLWKLQELYHLALKRSTDMELATDTQHIGDDLYQIIADGVINRDIPKTMELWDIGKTNSFAKLHKVAGIADTPMEHVRVADAQKALYSMVEIFERDMLPFIQREPGVSSELAAIDDKIDKRIADIELSLQEVAKSMSEENQEAAREFHAILENRIRLGLSTSLIGLVLALFISIFTVRRIIRVLSELTYAAREMEHGNYLVSLEYQSDDEIGVLAKTFRNMSEEVKKRTVELQAANEYLQHSIIERKLAEAKLQEANEGLDIKVRERTTELSRANELLRQEISFRKHTEDALKKSEERYRSLAVATTQIVWTTSEKGEVVEDQPSWRAFTGQSEQEIKGWGWSAALHPEDFQRSVNIWSQAIRTCSLYENEYRLRRQDGDYRFFTVRGVPVLEEDGNIREWIGACTDITESRIAEEEIRKSEARLKEAQRLAHIGSWELCLNNNVLLWSDESYRIFEKDPKDFGATYEAFLEIVHPEDRAMVDQAYTGSLKSKTPYEIVHRLLMPDGRIKYVHEQCETFYDQDGEPMRSIGTTQDITERKQAEEEVKALQEQFRQSQKMEGIGQLAGGIAHDFNNILTVIKGYSELSLMELKEGDPLCEHIQKVQSAANRASALTRQILAFSRRQIMEMKVIDLNAVLRDLDKMLRRLIGEDIELVSFLEEDLGRVKADQGQIEQVIMNLSVNARDSMPTGGKLTMETDNVELDKDYARGHIAVEPGRYVMLSVSDTGCGIPSEIRNKIFEPFFTTKAKGKGTGLGLSTVYGIVKQSGGDIWVYSEPGEGTTFKIYLPRVDEPLTEFVEKAKREGLARGRETILIVEDDREVRKVAARMLKKQGYKVLEAQKADEAMALCERLKEPVDLVLTDVVMPEMSGRQLVESLKQARQDFKVLYMSGYTDDAIVHHGVLEGDAEFIQKPFTFVRLSEKVREVLDK